MTSASSRLSPSFGGPFEARAYHPGTSVELSLPVPRAPRQQGRTRTAGPLDAPEQGSSTWGGPARIILRSA